MACRTVSPRIECYTYKTFLKGPSFPRDVAYRRRPVSLNTTCRRNEYSPIQLELFELPVLVELRPNVFGQSTDNASTPLPSCTKQHRQSLPLTSIPQRTSRYHLLSRLPTSLTTGSSILQPRNGSTSTTLPPTISSRVSLKVHLKSSKQQLPAHKKPFQHGVLPPSSPDSR